METQFRIKEISIYKDGSNIWYYPEIMIPYKKTVGILWWKKEKIVEDWQIFVGTETANKHIKKSEAFLLDLDNWNNVIGFKDFEKAKEWLENKKIEYKIDVDEWCRKRYKYLGALIAPEDSKDDTCKIHNIS